MDDKINVTPVRTLNRRSFLRGTAGYATTALAGYTLIASTAHANDPSVLNEDDPIALALGYKADATQVDISRYPKKAGEQGSKQICANCTLYTEQNDALGLCAAVPGKLVAGAGWCQAWVGNV